MIQVEVDRWVAEGMIEEAHAVIRKIRTVASTRSGFLSGNLLQRVDDHHHCCSVAQWASMEDWKAWERSEERRTLNAKVAAMLTEPETTIIFEPI